MRVINIIINMDDIRQERPNEGPILKLNKKLKQNSLKKVFGTSVKESMAFQALKKQAASDPRSKVISGKPP